MTGGPTIRAAIACNCHLSDTLPSMPRLNLVHVPSHQLDARVLEGLAGLVVHGDPADDVDQVAFLGRDDVVVGLPSSCRQ